MYLRLLEHRQTLRGGDDHESRDQDVGDLSHHLHLGPVQAPSYHILNLLRDIHDGLLGHGVVVPACRSSLQA